MNESVDAGGEDPVEPLLARAAQAFQADRPADAIAPLSEAAALRPEAAGIRCDLGRAWLETGEFAHAIASLRQAVALDATLAQAWLRMGAAFEKLGDAHSALAACQRAAAAEPGLAEAWFRAGALAHLMSRQDDAIAHFRRAAEAGPATRFGRLGAARALLTKNHDVDAERVLQAAVAADPDDALALDLLGNLLVNWGRFDEAHACYARAVALAPQLAGSYYDLVRCRPVTSADEGLMARMEAALATPGLATVQRQRLYLAMGKAAEDLGDHAQAMARFAAADALRPGSQSFNSAAFDRMIDGIIERCSAALMASPTSAPAGAGPAPILVVGMPRSGTTLVEQIIASHPDVCAGGELPFWTERGAGWHLVGAAARDPNYLPEAADRYRRFLRTIDPDAPRLTDKMPFNFLWAGAILRALPDAVIVHCRRAPIDTALSIQQTPFHPDLQFPTGGARLVAYFRSYERLTRHWRAVLPAHQYVEVDYEGLTRDPEPAIRRIVQACGLSWNAACLRPDLKPGAVRTPSNWQVRQPINRGSVERWRRYEPWLGVLRELLDDPSPAA
jgi:tetratricopeptide (TPR) repeat protein